MLNETTKKAKATKHYYVTMTDSFMSNWGLAKNLQNKLIFICKDYEEAQIVADNAEYRGDQKYINICSNKPQYYRANEDHNGYKCNGKYVQVKTNDDYSAWYKKDNFKKRDNN